MAFPEDEKEAEAQGYQFDNEARCRGCGEAISWWITPNGKRMPMNLCEFKPHWSTCPQAEQFRREKSHD